MPQFSPLVSIKIASYNHARFIGKTIQSVLDQSYQNFELVIVDDCSRDNSVEVIQSFSDPRITLLINESNVGAAVSSKKAKGLCQGKYFCSLDSDDYFHPAKLAQQVAYLEKHPEVDLVATFVQEVDDQDNLIAASSVADWFNQDFDFNQPESWLWENHICHSSVLIKKGLHDQVWDYDSCLPYTNDWNNWIRFLASGAEFRVISEKLTFYRKHAENITHKNPARTYWEYAYISATVLHPYLEKINRRDLVRDNLEKFFSDVRYPVVVTERNNFLRLLLGVNSVGDGFESIWNRRFGAKGVPKVRNEFLLIDDLRQELIDSRLRINSLRIELQRAENEIFKVARLLDVLVREEFSSKKLAKIAYLMSSCVIPDFAKWSLRPLTRRLRQQLRRLQNANKVAAYQVKVRPVGQQQKRVLHAIANFMTGGSSRLVVDIVEGLGHTYHQEILTGFIPVPAAYQGVAIRECRSRYEILAFLEKFRPDVLHVHYWGDVDFGWYDKVFRAAEQVGCKVIENINTPVVPYRSQVVRQYVYVSEYVMQDFGRSGEPGVVIHPGSDIEYYSRKGLEAVPDNCIGMVYRLEADKLNFQSIDVFIEVARRRPGTKILIVGGGSFLEAYKHTVFANGVANSFCFTGAISYTELPSIYAQMSIFVAPVWKESFGQVSIFAMSMGIPVVGYRVGGLAEIVADDELLAPVGDSKQLASVIVKLLDDREKRRAIGAENQLRVKSLFSVETMIQRYEMLYRSVISESA